MKTCRSLLVEPISFSYIFSEEFHEVDAFSLQAFHPSEDELTRKLSTVEIVLDGEKRNDLQTVESILDSAKVQALWKKPGKPKYRRN